MYPTGGSGDLYVTIKESDGSEQFLVVPYASVPVLQREGRLKYAMTAGVYRAYDNGIDKAPLAAGTAIYGLPAGYTVYGGGQFSKRYQALALGIGKNLGPIGALSTDITQAWSQQKIDHEKKANPGVFATAKTWCRPGLTSPSRAIAMPPAATGICRTFSIPGATDGAM